MIWLIYAAACWPLASIIAAALICRQVHKANVREGIEGWTESGEN